MQVKTTSGIVEGCWKDGYYNFLGIPYAKAEKREWEGVYKAFAFGRKAPQSCQQDGEKGQEGGAREYGEDCLNLNIYVPGKQQMPRSAGRLYVPQQMSCSAGYSPNPSDARLEEREKLPVAVYIHGGAFQNGSNRDRSGAQVIRDHRFIYVSVNYRLGVLGYLYLGKVLGETFRHTDTVKQHEWHIHIIQTQPMVIIRCFLRQTPYHTFYMHIDQILNISFLVLV